MMEKHLVRRVSPALCDASGKDLEPWMPKISNRDAAPYQAMKAFCRPLDAASLDSADAAGLIGSNSSSYLRIPSTDTTVKRDP